VEFKPTTVKDWCLNFGAPYRILLPSWSDVSYGPNYHGLALGPETPITLHEEYMAEIPNCQVVGGFEGAFVDNRALMDILYRPKAGRYYIPTPPWGPAFADLNKVVLDGSGNWTVPEGILLQSWYGPTFYHWAVDHLSKLLMVELDHVPKDVPLLVHEWVTQIPPLMDMLRQITQRPVVKLTTGTVYAVEHLYLPSSPCMPSTMQEEAYVLEPGDVIIRREAVEFLRARLKITRRGQRHRFFIDRQGEPTRLINKNEVRQVFSEFGFQSVQPEMLTFKEQQSLFASASIIAGQSGAGLVNVLLAPPSASLICLQAKPWKENPYANLAAYGGQRSLFIAGGDSDAPSASHAQFTVDTDKLRATLTEVLA
jgi:hypothetical protein